MSARQGHDLVARLENPPRPADDLLAGRGDGDVVGLPLDELYAEVVLQLLQLRRERRLADETALRRPAEMPRVGHRHEVAEIFQFDVGHCVYRYMASIEIIKSIHWINRARAPMITAFPMGPGDQTIYPGASRHVRHWSAFPRFLPHRRGLERPQGRIQAPRSGQLSRQVEGRVLLAEGLHLRLPDGDRGFRQAREGVPGPRRAGARRQ